MTIALTDGASEECGHVIPLDLKSAEDLKQAMYLVTEALRSHFGRHLGIELTDTAAAQARAYQASVVAALDPAVDDDSDEGCRWARVVLSSVNPEDVTIEQASRALHLLHRMAAGGKVDASEFLSNHPQIVNYWADRLRE